MKSHTRILKMRDADTYNIDQFLIYNIREVIVHIAFMGNLWEGEHLIYDHGETSYIELMKKHLTKNKN